MLALLVLRVLSTASLPFAGWPTRLSNALGWRSRAEVQPFARWPARCDNTLVRQLRAEPDTPDRSPYRQRQVTDAHYTLLRPTVAASQPTLVIYSADVAHLLDLAPAECNSTDFVDFFAGQVPSSVECWATVYGASFAGRFGGQRGDGRAISIGQLTVADGTLLEVQLKGAGRTPYSRTADGRAVLRSTIREFLGSEAMAALGVPTTRALCVISSGDLVGRRWYDDTGQAVSQMEPGAIGTRVASSFLRFGQFELLWHRGESTLLRELAEHTLTREFSHIVAEAPDASRAEHFVQMFDEVCQLLTDIAICSHSHPPCAFMLKGLPPTGAPCG